MAFERLLIQALSRPDLPKSMRAECVPIAEWIESVVSIMLGTGNRVFLCCDHRLKVVGIQCEVSFIFSRFKNRSHSDVQRTSTGRITSS